MKGYRFFLEYPSKTEKNKATVKNPGNHLGTVVAMILDTDGRGHGTIPWRWAGTPSTMADGIATLFDRRNSDVGATSVAMRYLDEKCKRIPERLAREIHPALFEYLDE